MWIFTYGSLMGDGWEREFGCLRREVATLVGYTRSFTKASTANWGSKSTPCPTLRIVPQTSAKCLGIAFEFEGDAAGPLKYLAAREGTNFDPIEVTIELASRAAVEARTYIYSGTNLIKTDNVAETLQMLKSARGTSGTGSQYLRKVYDTLKREGIDDGAVDDLWNEFCR
ncbi:gamma-glutamylcyclotransferase [Rhizobium gallicum]|nr:gamma-glutamylcyclotransferase [Rhizobium gallicum]